MTTKKALIISGVAVTLFGIYMFTRHRKARQIQNNLTTIANDPGKKVASPTTGIIHSAYGFWGDE